jgi:hypothetical protein
MSKTSEKTYQCKGESSIRKKYFQGEDREVGVLLHFKPVGKDKGLFSTSDPKIQKMIEDAKDFGTNVSEFKVAKKEEVADPNAWDEQFAHLDNANAASAAIAKALSLEDFTVIRGKEKLKEFCLSAKISLPLIFPELNA